MALRASPFSRNDLHSAVQPPVNAFGNQAMTTAFLPLNSDERVGLAVGALQREVGGLVADLQLVGRDGAAGPMQEEGRGPRNGMRDSPVGVSHGGPPRGEVSIGGGSDRDRPRDSSEGRAASQPSPAALDPRRSTGRGKLDPGVARSSAGVEPPPEVPRCPSPPMSAEPPTAEAALARVPGLAALLDGP